ncbi:MAG: Asp-tRNA(Asn)/Glu-tRNA(Gln) amidotransferase subunit GatC [Holophagaceae bacterium]
MDVTREEVLRCAALAGLKLEEAEIEPLRDAMARMLDRAGRLQALDLEGVEPLARALPLALPRREDVPEAALSQAQALANAPEVEDGQFRVPKAF